MSANVTHLAFGYGIQADVYCHIMIILTKLTFPSIALACASTPNDTLTALRSMLWDGFRLRNDG